MTYSRVLAGLLLVAALFAVAPATAIGQEPAAAQETEHAAEAPAGEHAAEQDPEHAEADDHAADDHGAEGDHGEAEHHGPTLMEYVFKWINFFLLLGLLWWLLVTPPAFVVENFDFAGLKVLLAARAQDVVSARELARQQVEEAQTRLAESESRLARVEEEAAGLVVEAQEGADRERLRLVAEAEAEAAKIRELADRDMGAEVSRARRQLRRHVADLAVATAADMVKENFSGEDQERLVREYLDRLGRTVA